MLAPALAQKWTLVGAVIVSVIVLLTALEDRFGVKDPVRQLIEERKRRERQERDAWGEAAKKVERWRKAVERKALTK